MERDKAAELRGTTLAPRELDHLPAARETSLDERVRSGEFNLYKNFVEIGGPRIFE